LTSKSLEDVRKRRAKPSKIYLNIYQKIILLAGALALFLTIGTSSAMAPTIAAGVVAGTLFLLWVLKYVGPKKEDQSSIASGETGPPTAEKKEERQDIDPVEEEEKGFSDSPENLFEEQEGNLFEKQEEVAPPKPVQIQEAISPGKELRQNLQEDPEKETLADLKQRLAFLEEKVAILEGMLMSLEGKAAGGEEEESKPGAKIDLETALEDTDEKPAKKVDEVRRSVFVIR
jgi:hypothetical protein